jgi:hypothetical protein
VGAACVWRTQEGWTGRRFHLGTTRRCSTPRSSPSTRHSAIEQRQERGRQYTVFVDSTSAITRVRDDDLGPGQRFAVAAIEVCSRIIANDNSVTIRWVPAHSGATGNEVADRYAKSAATGEEPVEAIPEGYAAETSLSHMTRVATEARSKETREWITAHVRPERRYRPPPGRGLRRPPLRRARKTLAGRYYQLLIGACGDGDTPETVRKDRHGRVLVVYEWRAAVEASPVHAVRVVDGAEAQIVEGRGGGVRVGAPTHPIGETLVGRQGGGGGFGVPADYEGRMHRSGEGPPGG